MAKRPKSEGGKDKKRCCKDKGMFDGLRIHVLPAGFGKQRLNIFRNRIEEFGAVSMEILNENSEVTHVVIEDSVDEETVMLALGNMTLSANIVRSKWLSDCLLEKKLLDVDSYRVAIKLKQMGSSTQDKLTSDESAPKTINVNKFACSRSSAEKPVTRNLAVVEKLQALVETFKSTSDHWRAVGYEKAITALKNHPKDVTTWEEARSLPGVGDRLADKILEVVESGRLRKEEELCNTEQSLALQLFMKVWGVGPSTAQLWVQQGFHTLEDLKTKANLNRHQKIGLKHFDDFQERMPRAEAAEIETTVRQAVLALLPNVVAVACGSYRRGKSSCGDVDVLVTHPDGTSHCGLLPRIISSLKAKGFLTDDLVSLDDKEFEKHQKYMGVCKLPGSDTKHRRLDIIVIPYSEYACALLYFTGSAHFNRSMRLLAKKLNLHLSEHSLNTGVVRKGVELIGEGTPLETPTEKSVFEHLGIPYRPPEERDL